MALGAHGVEHDAVDLDVAPEAEEALDQGRHALRHAARVDDEEDGQAEQRGEIGGRARPVRGAVEEAHHALADDDVGIPARIGHEPGQGLEPHRPAVEIAAGPAGGPGVKGGVDIVGADLEAADLQPLVMERAQQARASAASCRSRIAGRRR